MIYAITLSIAITATVASTAGFIAVYRSFADRTARSARTCAYVAAASAALWVITAILGATTESAWWAIAPPVASVAIWTATAWIAQHTATIRAREGR